MYRPYSDDLKVLTNEVEDAQHVGHQSLSVQQLVVMVTRQKPAVIAKMGVFPKIAGCSHYFIKKSDFIFGIPMEICVGKS